MKSVASHFLNMPHTREEAVDAASNGCKQMVTSVSCNMKIAAVSDDVTRTACNPPHSSSVSAPRPVFIRPLLRSPRVGETVVLLDGVPCGAVCFSGRVVRCEGPQRNGSASALRPYTALLISDTTGIISVMHLHRTRSEATAGAALADDASFLTGDAAEVAGSADDESVCENDYVFVVGWLAFADVSKEVRHLLQGAVDFVTGGDGTKADGNCFCVRGAVRLIYDMNEIHFWALAALESHVRLLRKAEGPPRMLPTTKKDA
ncbi:hypothetical protein TraAM80_07696 [Trypanosoma rangeli]|uniref:Uncharacterized protein n=1 Tax=Trypanosoma rangeli TaxID=5698 RepID=A0A422N4C3_TRYRA|nr:uncharacterized protein TraAM80_07696 [Trypanosoma rangeli]RNF00304.1 hypothetical protein TraAM80_07696 [Trypanosoma rangeli]|eukprot:RNF00304.1 hypothetical protein TraAM80_07696 [Trypanosoma rangeli]